LQRREQPRLFAAEVSPCSAMDHDIQIEAAALDVPAEPALRVRFSDCTSEPFGRLEVLTSNVDVGFVAADRERGDDHAFEQRMRIPLEDVPILEGTGLAFVGVDHQILGLWTGLRTERPLSRRWKTGSP